MNNRLKLSLLHQENKTTNTSYKSNDCKNECHYNFKQNTKNRLKSIDYRDNIYVQTTP